MTSVAVAASGRVSGRCPVSSCCGSDKNACASSWCVEEGCLNLLNGAADAVT